MKLQNWSSSTCFPHQRVFTGFRSSTASERNSHEAFCGSRCSEHTVRVTVDGSAPTEPEITPLYSKNLEPTLPTKQRCHWATSLEVMHQITCSCSAREPHEASHCLRSRTPRQLSTHSHVFGSDWSLTGANLSDRSVMASCLTRGHL